MLDVVVTAPDGRRTRVAGLGAPVTGGGLTVIAAARSADGLLVAIEALVLAHGSPAAARAPGTDPAAGNRSSAHDASPERATEPG